MAGASLDKKKVSFSDLPNGLNGLNGFYAEVGFGIENIAEIAEVSDGIMIGRGDMAVEIGYEKVPEAQKFLQKFSRENNLYHIVATEMLESMINSTIPSNSDISDITKAILEGADAIMLSGETTMGNHPSECVAVMKKLIEYNS